MDIGIIGCGLIGTKRAKAIREHRVSWVADSKLERAQTLAQTLGAAQATDRWEDVIGAKQVEAIIVSTTPDALATITLAGIQAGKHVLVEKPAARSTKELDPIVQAAHQHGAIVKVGFNHRFHPAVSKAKTMVESGEVGPLLFVRGRYGHGGRFGYDQEWRAKADISGGGELVDQGMHLIDLSCWFLGGFERVEGFLGTHFWDMEVEDNAFVVLQKSSGETAWLHASWTEWKNLFCFELCGRSGKLQIDGLGGSYGIERLTHYKMLPQMGPPEAQTWEYPGPDRSWELEFNHFVDAIRQKKQPSGNLNDARVALDIVDQIYRKAKSTQVLTGSPP